MSCRTGREFRSLRVNVANMRPSQRWRKRCGTPGLRVAMELSMPKSLTVLLPFFLSTLVGCGSHGLPGITQYEAAVRYDGTVSTFKIPFFAVKLISCTA